MAGAGGSTMQSACYLAANKRRACSRRGSPARPRRAPACLLLPLAALVAAPTLQAAPLPGPETRVMQPTSRGAVHGFIFDAQTRRPLAGTRVRLEEGGAFAESGPATALTDNAGGY